MKTNVFIGSSSEGEQVAREVQLNLSTDWIPHLWKYGSFPPGLTYIESLEKELGRSEYAILVLTPDDEIKIRGETEFVARDNVLFELGLFMGRLGRQRAFVICDDKVKIPTDLKGLNIAKYDLNKHHSLDVAVSIACTELIKKMRATPKQSSEAQTMVLDQILVDEDALCAAVAQWPVSATTKRILVSRRTTDWFWRLFQTCLSWRMAGIEVTVLAEKIGGKKSDQRREAARRNSMAELGVVFEEQHPLSIAGFFMEEDFSDQSVAIEVNESNHMDAPLAVRYSGRIHTRAVEALLASLPVHSVELDSLHKPILEEFPIDKVCRKLRRVTQYADSAVDITAATVDPKDLYLISPYARAYKYTQIQRLAKRYQALGLNLFTSMAVKLRSGDQSIVTPPVVEVHGEKAVVVEGTTRATFAFKQNHSKIKCILVNGVSEALPADPVPINEVSITERTLNPRQKAPKWTYERFRHIERTIHPY